MRYLLITLFLLMALPTFAQVYEKASDTQLKVTRQVEEVYDYATIKLRIQDLKDMQGEILSRANQEIAEKQKEIDSLTVILAEMEKLDIGKVKESVIGE